MAIVVVVSLVFFVCYVDKAVNARVKLQVAVLDLSVVRLDVL
jgi:hypothetical protein